MIRSVRLTLCLLLVGSSVSWADANEVAELTQRLAGVKRSIELTKEKIKSPQDIEYLADFYFMLAELQVESARLGIALKRAKFPKTPIEELDLTGERRPKLEAIETYKQIEARFPRYAKLDKVLFFMAHEHRELNQNDEAMAIYKKITTNFPDSAFWDESQLNIANNYFEKKDFDFAVEQYRKILNRKGSKASATAQYKIGWCYINKTKWLDALVAFEKSIEAFKNIKDQLKPEDLKNSDMREEALIASVWPFTELTPQEVSRNSRTANPISFYRKLSPDKFIYARVMNRLGRRLTIKKRHTDSASAYFEALRSMEEPMARIDTLEDYYRSYKEAKLNDFPSQLSEIVVETFMRASEVERDLPEAKRKATRYEAILRDVATSIHKSAMSTKRKDDLLRAAKSYEDYIYLFPKSKHTADMALNLAESYYHAGRKVEAARIYAIIARVQKSPDKKKENLTSAIQSLIESLSDTKKLSPLDKFRGRAGLLSVASQFRKIYPQDKMNLNIDFNMAKVLYDERNFGEAIPGLRKFIGKYPSAPESEQASLLLLDCFYQQDQLKDLVKEGKQLAAIPALPAATKQRIQQVAQEAQLRRVKSLAGDFSSKGYADKMLKLAASEGAGAAEPAMYEAFLSMKSAGDPRVFKVGASYIQRFPQDEKAKSVLLTLTQMALMSTDFSQAAAYLETFAMRYQNDPQATAFGEQAVQIYRSLGQYEEAAELSKHLGRVDQVLSILAEGRRWGKLSQEASSGSGDISLYYHGLALSHSGKVDEGMQMFQRIAKDPQALTSQMELRAHALYLVSRHEFESLKKLGQGAAISPKLIKEKVAALGQVEQHVQGLIATGVGRWIVAGLGVAGAAQKHIEDFLNRAPAPAGMNPTQFRSMMARQSEQYGKNAANFFDQCRKIAADNRVLTRFLRTCAAGAQLNSDDLAELAPYNKPANGSAPTEVVIRLLKDPRAVAELRKRLNQAMSNQAFGVAELVMNRIIEVEGDSSTVAAELGWLFLRADQYQKAFDQFDQASKKSGDTSSAQWGKASLFVGLGLNGMFEGEKQVLRGKRTPAGISHPWLSSASGRVR